MRKILLCFTALAALVLATPSAYAGGHGHGHHGGKGHDKQAVCHKPGTPAEHVLYLPEPAVQAHLNHGDYKGECRAPEQPQPPTCGGECPYPNPCPCPPPKPAPCPPTQTTTTVIDHVIVVDHGLPTPPAIAPAVSCVQVRDLLFFSPNGMLGRTTVSVGHRRVRVINARYRRSALRIKDLSLAGSGRHARLTIKSHVRRGDTTILFRWSGLVRRCGGWVVVDPVVPRPKKAKTSRSSWS